MSIPSCKYQADSIQSLATDLGSIRSKFEFSYSFLMFVDFAFKALCVLTFLTFYYSLFKIYRFCQYHRLPIDLKSIYLTFKDLVSTSRFLDERNREFELAHLNSYQHSNSDCINTANSLPARDSTDSHITIFQAGTSYHSDLYFDICHGKQHQSGSDSNPLGNCCVNDKMTDQVTINTDTCINPLVDDVREGRSRSDLVLDKFRLIGSPNPPTAIVV